MADHTLTHSENVLVGDAYFARYAKDFGGRRGVKVSFPIYVDLGSPAIADADGVSASQSVGAGANFLINGALASGGAVTFDTPRAVVAAWTTTSILTLAGLDVNGEAMTEDSASGTSHTGTKAFAAITSVTSTASITLATIGSSDVLGLPFYIADKNQVTVRFDGADDAATIVVGDTTTATTTTNDTRGTIDIAGTLDDTKTLSITMFIDRSTKALAHGVTQA